MAEMTHVWDYPPSGRTRHAFELGTRDEEGYYRTMCGRRLLRARLRRDIRSPIQCQECHERSKEKDRQ